MRIIIDRQIGNITFQNTDVDTNESGLYIFGQVECLHTTGGTIWYPTPQQLEIFLRESDPTFIVERLSAIEGQYLILWKQGDHLYIFCDRYSIQTVYYRPTTNALILFDSLLDEPVERIVTQSSAVAFVLLRYMPGRQTLFEDIFRLMPGDCLALDTRTSQVNILQYCPYPEDALGEIGFGEAGQTLHARFREALDKRLSRFGSGENFLLPLSGGLDSRYLLGTALELVPAERITAMTFGSPGSYDFEIGKAVSRAAGVRHLRYPLLLENYHHEDLLANCLDSDGQINFITEAPAEIYLRMEAEGRIVLSGYVGDAIMGNKADASSSSDPLKMLVKDTHIAYDDPLVANITSRITEEGVYYKDWGKTSIRGAELWFFVNHFTKYSHYCVFKNRRGLRFVNPFLDYRFVDFVLNLPPALRAGRNLYIDWIKEHFPRLADLPYKLYRGAPLNASPARRLLAYQLDLFNRFVIGKDRRVNTLDYVHLRDEFLEPKKLYSAATVILPAGSADRIFSDPRYTPILYNLKCLEILRSEFDVRFIDCAIDTERS